MPFRTDPEEDRRRRDSEDGLNATPPAAKAVAAIRSSRYNPSVERIVKKSRSFREADRWDIEQNLALTPEQRIQIAHALRKRAYPGKAKDVRECHRAR